MKKAPETTAQRIARNASKARITWTEEMDAAYKEKTGKTLNRPVLTRISDGRITRSAR